MHPLNSPTSSSTFHKALFFKWGALVLLLLLLGAYFLFRSRPTEKPKEENIPKNVPANLLEEESKKSSSNSVDTNPSGKHFYVSPNGDDNNTGHNPETPLQSIQKALDQAEPGDSIELADGLYLQDIVTRKDGTKEKRITITGSTKAVLKGAGKSHIIEINHSYITLSGFTVDGLYGSGSEEESYRDKLIYVVGTEPKKGVEGLRIHNMTLQNAGGECLRLRYFAILNEVDHNTIRNCGAYDFVFDGEGKNGEGIYIGTAPEQRDNGINPTEDIDISAHNWIHHNAIDTQGNECVDIKEGSEQNIVEYNSCTGQKDEESGGMDARGNKNVFRFNKVFRNKGAGFRLGGDKKNYGIENFIYQNEIFDNASGGIKIMRVPQGKICNNTLRENNEGDFVGKYADTAENTPNCT